MDQPTSRLTASHGAAGLLTAFGLMGLVLLAIGRKDYPHLHTVLDTGSALLSGELALLFWDRGARLGRPFPRWIALSFGVTFLLELIHALVTVEWSGRFAPIAQAAAVLRPATWPPAAYVLPIGLGASAWLLRRGGRQVSGFALALILLAAGLLAGFSRLPRYTPPTWLDITRPTLVLVPVLWAIVGWACWRLRTADRVLPVLVLMACVLLPAHVSMLYSQAPHDSEAMVAHLGKLGGYLVLLLALMQAASVDVLERQRAERELAQLNQQLERRILDRTTELAATNASLGTEIAARREAEGAARESYERTRVIIDTALDGVITMDHDGRITEFSQGAEQILGYRRSTVIGQPLAEVIIPPELREAHRRGLARYLATGEAKVLGKRLELTGLRADGSPVPVELSINRLPGSGPPTFAGFLRDITERKRTEEERQKFVSLVEQTDDFVGMMGLDGNVLYINRAGCQLVGLAPAQAPGTPVSDLHPDEWSRKLRDEIFPALLHGEGNWVGEAQLRHLQTRHPIDVLMNVFAVNHPTTGELLCFAAVMRDITDRKRAEEARERLAAIVESSDDAIIGKSLDSVITAWNPGAEKLFGFAAEEAVGKPMLMLIPPERVDEERDILLRIARGAKVQHFDTVRVRKDGTPVDVSVTASPVKDAQGKVVGASTVARDITGRKLAEAKVRAQLERLSLLHHITRAISGRQDLRSIYQVVLRTLEEDLALDFGCICDYEPAGKELVVIHVGIRGRQLAEELALTEQAHIPIDPNGLSRCAGGELVYEPDVANVRTPFSQRLARAGLRALVAAPLRAESRVFGVLVAVRRQPQSFRSGECEFLRQLSEHVALAAHQAQLHGALQRAYDDLRQTQQAVLQQERLRALGEMASGVAHDINNAILPIGIYAESLLAHEPNLSAGAREDLAIIQRASSDVAQTVARLGEFYRQREMHLPLAPIQLNHLVKHAVDLTRARWSDMPQRRGIVVRMQLELAEDLPVIMAVESEIREALTNLVFNAVDAMPNGGTLTLRTCVARRQAGAAEPALPQDVQLEVADTGVGMDEDTRRRCLEPFFTTKGERGTGLGLAMVYGVLQRHNAEIEIDSTPGQGTTMRLVFPVASGILEPVHSAAAAIPPLHLRLLIVDDDPLVLKALRGGLEAEGHVVVTADGGQEGIDAFHAARERGESFAAVITDLGMPHIDGRRVAAAVKAESPATPVILLTGWGLRMTAEGDLPPQVDRVLSKPPKLRDLREALAQCCRGTIGPPPEDQIERAPPA